MKFTNLQLRDEFWRDMLYPEKLEHLVIFEDIDGWVSNDFLIILLRYISQHVI